MTMDRPFPFPIKTAVWQIRLLRLVFRHRWWVQIGQKVYVLREPQ